MSIPFKIIAVRHSLTAILDTPKKLAHLFPRTEKHNRSIFGQLGEFKSILFHIHTLLRKVDEFKYLCLPRLKGKELIKQIILKLLPIRWTRIISPSLPSIDQTKVEQNP